MYEVKYQKEVIQYHNDNIYFEYYGDKESEVLILCNSFLSDHTSFTRLLPEMTRYYDVLIWNYPGQALSSVNQISTIGNPEYLAKILEHIIHFLQIEHSKINIVGISSGGYVALELALLQPELLKNVILVGSILKFTYPTYYKILSYYEILTKKQLDLLILRIYSDLYSHNFLKSIDGIINQFTDSLKEKYSTYNTILSYFHKWKSDFLLNLKNETKKYQLINNHIHYIYGDEDSLLQNFSESTLDSIFINSEAYIIPNTGHYPHIEKPKDFFKLIRKIIQQNE